MEMCRYSPKIWAHLCLRQGWNSGLLAPCPRICRLSNVTVPISVEETGHLDNKRWNVASFRRMGLYTHIFMQKAKDDIISDKQEWSVTMNWMRSQITNLLGHFPQITWCTTQIHYFWLNVISHNFLDCLHIDKCIFRFQSIIILWALSQSLKLKCWWGKYKAIFFLHRVQ